MSLKQSLQPSQANKPLLMLCGTVLAAITVGTAAGTAGAFYARDILHNANLFIWFTVIGTCITFIVAPLQPLIVNTVGKKNGYTAGGAFGIVGALGIAVAPSVPIVLVASAISGIVAIMSEAA